MRLIDADHAEKVFSELMNLPHDYCGPSDIKISIDAVFGVLGQVPDADPIKHGRWIFIEQLSGGYYSYKCSECQHLENVEKRQMLGNYCSYCGTKMDGEVEC